MNEPFQSGFELDECAEINHTSDRATSPISGFILRGRQAPRIRLELLHSHGDATLFGIDLEDLHLNFLTDRKQIGSFGNSTPRKISNMQKSIYAPEIDKGTVVHQAAHRAANNFSLAYLGVLAVFRETLVFFKHGVPVDYHVFIGGIELDDATANFLFDQFSEFGRIVGSAARSGHEGADANVDTKSAFHNASHCPNDRRLVG